LRDNSPKPAAAVATQSTRPEKSHNLNGDVPENESKPEAAQHIASHERPARTTEFSDRCQDDISLEEVEQITI
jgi:hypothetical protein